MSDPRIKIIADYQSNVAQGVKADTASLKGIESAGTSTKNSVSLAQQEVEKFKQALATISPNNFKALSSAAQQLQSNLANITGADKISDAFKGLDSGNIQTMVQSSNTLVKEFSRQSSSAKSASDSIKEVGTSAQASSAKANASTGAFGNLTKSLLRIAKLRFLRGIIRSITQGFSEGLGNIYAYSQALRGLDASNASGTLDSIASSFLYLKNSLGAAVIPLLSSIAPILAQIVDWAVLALNAIAQLFAVLGGQSTYTRAKKTQTAWKGIASGASGAAAAAQEYKNTILGFDEIHALNDPNSGGGGGGGGGGASPGIGDMFEEVPLEMDGLQGLLNKTFKLLKPLLDTAYTWVTDWADGVVTLLDGSATAVMGVFSKDKEQFYRGMDEIQSVFAKYEFFNKIATWGYEASASFFSFLREVRIGVLELAQWITEKLQIFDPVIEGLNKVFGWNIPTFKDLSEGIEQDIQHSKEALDVIEQETKLYESWLNGEITSEELTKKLQELGKGANDTSHNFLTLSDQIKQSLEIEPKTTGITGAFNRVGGSISDVASNILTTKTDLTNFSNMKPGMKGIMDGFGKVNSSATDSKKSIEDNITKIGNLDKTAPSMKNPKDALGGIADKAKGASDRVWGIANAMNSVNGMKASVTITATTVASAALDVANKIKKSLGFADGGFVPGFANGGFIPAYANGSINTASLFMARENGLPEMVGQIGGHTAVANNGQIVEAVSRGVANAVSAVLGSGANGNVEVNVTLDGQRIARAVDNANRVRNRRFNVQA